ncbi:MAG: polyprenyl synthetase family protein [Deltaproteobacteria bacterium]|nr:polyprenyl synthetase family protein [Deltaproteobacteria bacterium]
MDFSDILTVINNDLEEVEQELEANIKSPVPLVYEISKHLLDSGGKRLRPAVLLLSSGACGRLEGKERIYSAATLELIHTATLLHDDVVDDAKLRRGKPSSNIVWGNKATVLVGDFMLAKALGLIQSCGNLELIKAVTDAAAKLAEGQVLEVMNANNMLEVTQEVCFGIIENKTASLLESCGTVGAILAGVEDGLKRSVGQYGFNIGIAFQLTDDALDYSSTEEEFGKGVGQDLIEGKMTLPLFYSIQEASSSERSKINDILVSEEVFTEDDLGFVRDIVERYKGVQKTNDMAQEYVEKAKHSISSLPDTPYKKSLDLLAEYIVDRRG